MSYSSSAMTGSKASAAVSAAPASETSVGCLGVNLAELVLYAVVLMKLDLSSSA